jgi:hypothetical protein
MAVSDGKGAGSTLIEAIGAPRALIVAAAIVLPGSVVTLALVIWAIAST